MATNKRTYPNDYFAWFNDDQRLAILSLDTTSTDSSERTSEKYDTFQVNLLKKKKVVTNIKFMTEDEVKDDSLAWNCFNRHKYNKEQ